MIVKVCYARSGFLSQKDKILAESSLTSHYSMRKNVGLYPFLGIYQKLSNSISKATLSLKRVCHL